MFSEPLPASKHHFKVFLAASLDNFIARPNGDISWLTDPPSPPSSGPPHLTPSLGFTTEDAIKKNMAETEYIILGRRTWEKILEMGLDTVNQYAGREVLVLSGRENEEHQLRKRSLKQEDNENVRWMRNIDEILEYLHSQPSGRVYVEGGNTVKSFLDRDLIDAITITTVPIILGCGIPLFAGSKKELNLVLLETCLVEHGMIISRYSVVRERVG